MDSKRIMALFAFAGLALIASHPVWATVDLTAHLRSLGEGNYSVTVSGGEAVDNLVAGAVDGNLTADWGRALALHGNSANKVEPAFELHVDIAGAPEKGLRVSSFRLYRLHSGSWNYITRTTRDFSLEASSDGVVWTVLYRTPEKQVWTGDTLYRDYTIPPEKRGCYHSYRIKMYPDYSASTDVEDNYAVGFQELVLYGELGKVKVWNGTEGATWDSSTPNWTGFSDAAAESVWEDGSQANFGPGDGEVVVDGEKQVDGLMFSPLSDHVITGSRLNLYPSANILAAGDSVLGNDLCNTNSLGLPAHTGWFPMDTVNSNRSLRVCLWKNRRLDDMTFTGGTMWYNSKTYSVKPYFMVRQSDATAVVQFQAQANGPVFSFKVLFDQDGSDVYGQIQWVKFNWNIEWDEATGHDFTDGGAYSSGYIYDGTIKPVHYGLKGLTAEGGDAPPRFVVRSRSEQDRVYSATECLPRSDKDKYTGESVTYFKNRKVKNLAGVESGEIVAHTKKLDAGVYYFKNDGSTASAQFQALMPSGDQFARVCVKVVFTQDGDDIAARAQYAKYNWDNLEVHDFDNVADRMEIRGMVNNSEHGYSVRDIKVRFKGELTLTGKLGIADDITVCENTVLTLGADSLTLDNSYAGDGSVRFASRSGSAQTVTVNAARSMADVIVDGDLTLNIYDGASLSVSGLSFGPDASLSVTTDSPAGTFKVGTGKCLGLAELSKIKLNGNSVYQGDDGVLLRRPGLILTIQ